MNDNNSNQIEDFPISICEEHNLPIHSYTEKPESELCDECINEVSGMGLTIKPLPKLLQYLDQLIETILQNFRKNKEKSENFINSYKLNENSETGKARGFVESFYQKLLNICDEVTDEKFKNFASLAQIIADKNKVVKEVVDKRKSEIRKLELQMAYLRELNNEDLVRNVEGIERILNDVQFDEVEPVDCLSFVPSKKFIGKISNLVASVVKVEFRMKREKWLCEKCKELVRNGEVVCGNCESFRPINSYPGVYNSLPVISQEEVVEINLRREIELKQVEMLSRNDAQGTYFIIPSSWLESWKDYIHDRSTSTNPGHLPPDPIPNHLLFENEECTVLKRSLLPLHDYRFLPSDVWSYLHKIYKGGPPLKRKSLSIYMPKPK